MNVLLLLMACTSVCCHLVQASECLPICTCIRPVGSSRVVERPLGVTSEAARSAEKICDLFFGGKEAALAASRYIEGHALALCKENSIQAEIKHTASS